MKNFNAANLYFSSAFETSSLVTGSVALTNPVRLLGFVANSSSGSNAYVQVFDGHATPAGGAVPLFSMLIPAGGLQGSTDLSAFEAISFKVGIVVVLSSTLLTYTAVSSSLALTPCGWVV